MLGKYLHDTIYSTRAKAARIQGEKNVTPIILRTRDDKKLCCLSAYFEFYALIIAYARMMHEFADRNYLMYR